MRWNALLSVAILASVVLVPPAWSREGSRGEEGKPDHPAATQSVTPTPQAKPLPPLSRLLFARTHNKMVHFPIALGLTGALFVWLSWKWPRFEESARILWLLAGIAAIAAVVSGEAQEEALEKGPLHEIVEIHETLGTLTALSLWVGTLLLWIPRLRRFAWLWTLIVVALVSITGFYGGILAHTD